MVKLYNRNHSNRNKKFSPTQVLVLGFAITILVGALLLTLPVATSSGNGAGFINAIFTATSAVCVTGLVVVDTGTYWSAFGQSVIIILIQIGGLGFMTMTTLFFLISGKKITIKERLVIQTSLNTNSLEGVVRFTKYVLLFTLVVEGIGVMLLSLKFIPQFGYSKGIVMSIFHSISAFCNAGFDLVGNYQSFTPYANDFIINFTVCLLIIIGGLGFSVINDILKNRKFKKFTLHTKLVLCISGGLIIIGAFLILCFEFNNSNTMKDLPWYGKIFSAFFQSVTPRTAGFNTLDTSKLTTPSIFLTMLFMFIGGSPGSTAGGVKTTTLGILILTVISVLRGKNDTEIFSKRIVISSIKKALAVVTIALLIICIAIMILSITEDASFVEIAFEAISAFGTVGLSMGITSSLSIIGKIIIIFTMFIGRVGPLTIAFAVSQMQSDETKGNYKYPEGNILLG